MIIESKKINDLDVVGSKTIIILNKRRYVCKNCGKKFYEKYDFLGHYQRSTKRCRQYVIHRLRNTMTYKQVAEDTHISITTAIRWFSYVNYTRPASLPKAISIDEFKGDTDGEKYQCILVDADTSKVIDIINNRNQGTLIN